MMIRGSPRFARKSYLGTSILTAIDNLATIGATKQFGAAGRDAS